MKTTKHLLFFSIFVFCLIAPAFAQNAEMDRMTKNEESDRTELYKRFYAPFERTKAIRNSDPNLEKPESRKAYDKAAKEAYDFATEFMKRYPDDTNPQVAIMKKFIALYGKAEKSSHENQLSSLVASKKYDEAFKVGKEMLSSNPNDLPTLSTLINAGILAGQSDSDAYDATTIQYSRKAISLVEGGATMPGKSKEDMIGLFHYAIGLSSLKTAPDDSVKAFIKVATIPNALQKTPQTFYFLALSYQNGEYGRLLTSFKTQCTTQEQLGSDGCKTTQQGLNKVIDRMIDANARVVSFCGTDASFAEMKDEVMKLLPGLYKYRHSGKEDGLNEYIAAVTTKDLPQ